MPPKDPLLYPFLTRDMLAFEHGTVFSLSLTTQSTVNGRVEIRGLTREGIFTFRHATDTTGLPVTTELRIPDIPIWVSVLDIVRAFFQGEVYASLALFVNGDRLLELCSGLVYEGNGISYPSQVTDDQLPQHGNFTIASGADPAAGVECSIVCPPAVIWRVRSFGVTLVTDATVANRRVHVVFSQLNSVRTNCFSSIDQTASLTRLYSVAKYGAVPDETDDNDILITMPDDIWLTGDDEITTATTSLQAGDNFGVPSVMVEEFFKKSI